MRLVPVLVVYLVVCAVTQPGGAVRDEPALLAAAERLVEHGQRPEPRHLPVARAARAASRERAGGRDSQRDGG